MNNAFIIKEKKGVIPWILRKIKPSTTIDVCLVTEGYKLLCNGISLYSAIPGIMYPYYYQKISFVYNDDNLMYNIVNIKPSNFN